MNECLNKSHIRAANIKRARYFNDNSKIMFLLFLALQKDVLQKNLLPEKFQNFKDINNFYQRPNMGMMRDYDKIWMKVADEIPDHIRKTIVNDTKKIGEKFTLEGFIIKNIKRQRKWLDITDITSFYISSLELRLLSGAYAYFDYIYSVLKKADIIGSNDNFYFMLDIIREDVMKNCCELKGYWLSHIKRIVTGQPGGASQKNKMQQRIEGVKNLLIKKGKRTDEGLKIKIGEWHSIFLEVFRQTTPIAYPTMKKYQKVIEEEIGKIIILKKW